MSEWVYIQAEPGEQLMQLHSFSIIKKQPTGDVQFSITVKEFAVPPPGQRVRFFAEADKQIVANYPYPDYKEGVSHFVEKRPPNFPDLIKAK